MLTYQLTLHHRAPSAREIKSQFVEQPT